MGARFRAATSVSVIAAGVSVSKPTGTVDNDTIIVFITVPGSGTSITEPAGWALVKRQDATGISIAAYSKIAASEGGSWNWTLGGSVTASGHALSFEGGDPLEAVNDVTSQANVSGTNIPIPSLSMPTSEMMLVAGYVTGANVTHTAPTDMIERTDVAASHSASTATQFGQGPGDTGTRFATASSAAINIGMILSIGESRRIVDSYEIVQFGTEEREEVRFE
jgi:hypothetical protein